MANGAAVVAPIPPSPDHARVGPLAHALSLHTPTQH